MPSTKLVRLPHWSQDYYNYLKPRTKRGYEFQRHKIFIATTLAHIQKQFIFGLKFVFMLLSISEFGTCRVFYLWTNTRHKCVVVASGVPQLLLFAHVDMHTTWFNATDGPFKHGYYTFLFIWSWHSYLRAIARNLRSHNTFLVKLKKTYYIVRLTKNIFDLLSSTDISCFCVI